MKSTELTYQNVIHPSISRTLYLSRSSIASECVYSIWAWDLSWCFQPTDFAYGSEAIPEDKKWTNTMAGKGASQSYITGISQSICKKRELRNYSSYIEPLIVTKIASNRSLELFCARFIDAKARIWSIACCPCDAIVVKNPAPVSWRLEGMIRRIQVTGVMGTYFNTVW